MKVVCIVKKVKYRTNPSKYGITTLKSYVVIPLQPKQASPVDTYKIVNDFGQSVYVPRKYFISLAEWRDKQLEEILE